MSKNEEIKFQFSEPEAKSDELKENLQKLKKSSFLLAFLHLKDKEIMEAIEKYQFILETFTDVDTKATVHQGLGICYWSQKNFQSAKEHFQTAFDLNPNLEITLMYAVFLFRQGNIKDAIYKLEHLIKHLEENYLHPQYAIFPFPWSCSNEPIMEKRLIYSFLRKCYENMQNPFKLNEINTILEKFSLISSDNSDEKNSKNFDLRTKELQKEFNNKKISTAWDKLIFYQEEIDKVIFCLPIQNDNKFSENIVGIYYWKPIWSLNKKESGPGHVSLQTKDIYASFWPKSTPTLKSGYAATKAKLYESLRDEVVECAKFSERAEGNPDHCEYIPCLDVKKINAYFSDFKQKLEKENNLDNNHNDHQWVLCSRQKNCTGLVATLLEEGGIGMYVSYFNLRGWMRGFRGYLFRVFLNKHYFFMSSIPYISIRLFLKDWDFLIAFSISNIPYLIGYHIFNSRKRFDSILNSSNSITLCAYIILPQIISSLNLILETKEFINDIVDEIIKWTVSLLAGILTLFLTVKISDYIVSCFCYGIDFLIRPDGIIKLANYATLLARTSTEIRNEVDALQYINMSAFLFLIVPVLSIFFSPSFTTFSLYPGILLEAGFSFYTRRKYFQKLQDLKNSWGRGNLAAKDDFLFLDSALKEITYTPLFLLLRNLGVYSGILIATYLYNHDSKYFAPMIGIGGLMGGLAPRFLYYLIEKLNTNRLVKKIDETKEPLLQRNKRSLPSDSSNHSISLSHITQSGVTIYSSNIDAKNSFDQKFREEKKEEDNGYLRTNRKFFCTIL